MAARGCFGRQLIVLAAVGYGFGRVNRARSRDAFGHGGCAMLGLVPFANLLLLFRRSKDPTSLQQVFTSRWLNGGRGILIGFAGAVADSVVRDKLDDQVQMAEADPSASAGLS